MPYTHQKCGTFGTLRCSEKLRTASSTVHLGSLTSKPLYKFAVNIRQATATRDWHFALVSCGEHEEARLRFKLEADGALSIFGSQENFNESSCPVMPVDWWALAAAHFSFWLLLCLLCCSGCACVFLLEYCCRRRRNKTKQAASELVIGRPCDTPEHGAVAEGQVNQKSPV